MNQQFNYELLPFKIDLISAFGTSHSLTTSRLNALLKVNQIGLAEIGLPPKKADCYLTDYSDVADFLEVFQNTSPVNNYDPFQEFKDSEFFCHDFEMILAELSRLDQIPDNPEFIAPKALFECALFEYLSQIQGCPVSKMVSLKNHELLSDYRLRNFFTLSYLEDRDQVIRMIDQGLKWTPNLKIKVGADVPYVMDILNRIYEKLLKQKDYPGLLSIDCNCSWTPAIAIEFLNAIKQREDIKTYLYMIEQPFPVVFEVDEWKEVKKLYTESNLEIFADESIKTYKDVDHIREAISGVNIKIEKSGGYRGAVRSVRRARELGLKVWIGTMIGSSLVANQAMNLMGLADLGGDIDGSLQVKKECELVETTFDWSSEQPHWGKVKSNYQVHVTKIL